MLMWLNPISKSKLFHHHQLTPDIWANKAIIMTKSKLVINKQYAWNHRSKSRNKTSREQGECTHWRVICTKQTQRGRYTCLADFTSHIEANLIATTCLVRMQTKFCCCPTHIHILSSHCLIGWIYNTEFDNRYLRHRTSKILINDGLAIKIHVCIIMLLICIKVVNTWIHLMVKGRTVDKMELYG